MEKQSGSGVVAPGFAGASGNIDPWYRVLPAFNTTNGWLPEPVLMGTMVGQEVVSILRKAQTLSSNAPVQTALKSIDLPGKARGETTAVTTNPRATPTITVGCIGEVGVVGLGGEVFNEIGEAIKEASPFPTTIVLTHCNAAGGYLPTHASYAEGGYEVQSSPFGPRAAEKVLEETTRMLQELREHQGR